MVKDDIFLLKNDDIVAFSQEPRKQDLTFFREWKENPTEQLNHRETNRKIIQKQHRTGGVVVFQYNLSRSDLCLGDYLPIFKVLIQYSGFLTTHMCTSSYIALFPVCLQYNW